MGIKNKNTQSGKLIQFSKEFLDLTNGGGEMGKLMRNVNWSETAVGPFATWPQSLKTALSICLGTKFPMFVWWGKNLTVFYNDGYIPFAGLKHPQFLGRPAREQWAEIWDALEPLTDQVINTGRATWAENMQLFMRRKGFLEETYFTFSYSPICDESGAVGGIINPCQESTERVLSERRLKTLHSVSTQVAQNILEVGKASAKMLGENAYDMPFALIYFTALEGKKADLIGAYGIRSGALLAPQTIDLTDLNPDPWRLKNLLLGKRSEWVVGLRSLAFEDLPAAPFEERPDSAYVLPLILSNQEQPSGFLILGISARLNFDNPYQNFLELIANQISTKISNIYALEEEKKRTQALAELDRAKTDFFSNVSHEFRTPLTLIMGPIEEILAKNRAQLEPSLYSEIEMVHRNALRLLKLVNTLLDFSRIEANRAQAYYEAIDLASFTSNLASAFDTAVLCAGLKLIINCPPLPEGAVYVDADMWEKIVLNLVSNALKYTLEGEIKVSLLANQDAVVFTVRDTGSGIPKNELSQIFQRFHRVQGVAGRNHEGTGIGLALVKDLVALHGGTISVESEVGHGSTFSVKIPFGDEHLPKGRVSKSKAKTELGVVSRGAECQRPYFWQHSV